MADRSYKLTLSLSDGSTINAGTITAPQGPNGANGVTFIPSVSEAGILSWANDGGLTNPDPVNIKGDAAVITESDVAGWGFTKNAGTITEIKMNGSSKGTSGVVDLGTVLTEHQSLENYVTLDGDVTQYITGKKSFTNTIVKKSTTIDLNAKPTSGTQWNYIEFTDKNDDRIGVAGSRFDEGGYAGVYLQARNGQQLWIASSTPGKNGNTVTKTSTPTPPDNDDSTQIANTAWVRSHNQAIRGFDGLNYYTVDGVKKYYPADNYFLVAYTDHCTDWKHVCAEMDVVDLDTRRAVYKLKASGLLESATSNNVTTYTNKGNIGVTDSFGERLNTGTTDINNEFFLVCRTTNKGRVRYEIWYNQRYAYNRHKFYFSVDEAHVRTGITQHFTWNKMRVDNAADVAYAKAGVTAYMDSKKVNPTYIPTSSWGVDVFKTALSNDESYTNVTIFNNNLYSTTQVGVSTILNTTPYIDAKIKGYSGYKTIPTSSKTAEYRILSEDKGYLGGVRYDRDTNGNSMTRLTATSTLSGACNGVMIYATKGTAETENTSANIWSFAPLTNSNMSLGTSSKSWSRIWVSANGNYLPDISMVNPELVNGTVLEETKAVQVIQRDNKGVALTGWRGHVNGTTGTTYSNLYARSFGTNIARTVGLYAKKEATSGTQNDIWQFSPDASNIIDLGSTSNRWYKAYVKRLNISSSIAVNDNGNVVEDASNGISFAGTKATTSMIRFANNDANTYGNGIVIGGGGVVIMGCGESADALYSALVKAQISAGKTAAAANTEVAQSENTYITSDNHIRLFSNCNNIANRKELDFNTNGQLVYTPTAGKTSYTYTLPLLEGTLALTSQLPTVNNGTLIIQKNAANVATFTANQSGNSIADIEVPTALSELEDDMKVIVNNTDQTNAWAFAGGGHTISASSTANSCVAIGTGSKTRYEKSIRIGTALGQTPTNQSVTQIGVNNYTSSGRALYLGAGYAGFTYMNAAGSSWTSASDIRDKTDIEEIDHALDFIKKLKPITYVMNEREKYLIKDENDNPILDENGKQQYDVEAHKRGDKKKHRRFAGLSAQDTYQAMLDCYDNNSNYAQIVDNNKFDHPDDEYIEQYCMSYERLVPFLIKAMQEQQAQIDALKIKIAS